MQKFVILFVLFLAGLWLSALAFNHIDALIGFALVLIDLGISGYYLIKFINIEIKKEDEKPNS